MVSRAIRLYGTELVDPPMRTLSAGPLSAEPSPGASVSISSLTEQA